MPDLFPAPPSPSAHLLPVYAHEGELVDAIRRHQVVVVEGPTGCGKTTQIPQILLRAGLTDKVIGVTQPRRIAAVSVAWRVAEEQAVAIGAEVGYCIRFDDKTSSRTRIKIMTDGILLQEARKDPDFEQYGVLIIDEAHERSLNIDFILGLLWQIIRRRTDLRVVISSATIQPERFVEFFREPSGGHVPVVRIDARPHPVEIVWRPLDSDTPDAVADAVGREVAAIHTSGNPGHVLVFLSGEDMIKRCNRAVAQKGLGRDLVILPLYGALTREDQERVFEPFAGKRKVVLATNIAETSITIDDTRYVIDSGLAKIPRVSSRTGLMALREEGISQASADQRLGRAGRTAPGRCIRLYSKDSYRMRPRFSDEEILRLDLAEVVLRLIDLGIRDVEGFPFPTSPQRARLRAALETLEWLGAIDRERHLTQTGRRMVPFPLTPNLARMVVEAGERFQDVVDEVLVVAAVLSGRSPFLYPPGHEDAARRAHDRFRHPLGDAVTAVQTFRAWQKAEDREQFCRKWYLDGNVMAFVASAHGQLADIAERQGILRVSGGDPTGIVRSVAAGFAQNILLSRGRFYLGPGDDKINIHPASTLYNADVRFAVAAEIVVSQRTYARQVSMLRGAWVVELRPDLAERFGLRRERLERAEGPPPELPRELVVGGAVLPIDARKGKPRVDIPFEAIQALRHADPRDLPADASRWQARIVIGSHVFAQGTPLGALLPILRLLPIPHPGDDLRCTVPEGALLEADRNLHALRRHLPSLLRPMQPHHGHKAGWVMLVANGGGGYWFEIGMDFREVLEVTLASLQDLEVTVEEDAETLAEVQAWVARLEPLVEQARDALETARRVRKQEREKPHRQPPPTAGRKGPGPGAASRR